MIKISKDIFKSKNIKYTRHRKLIFEILEKSTAPLSAQDIHNISKDFYENINLSTVYRILNLFLNKNIIVTLTVANAKKELFEIKKKSHNHYIICEKCEKKTSIKECPIVSLSNSIESETGFSMSSHKLELYGICSVCKTSK